MPNPFAILASIGNVAGQGAKGFTEGPYLAEEYRAQQLTNAYRDIQNKMAALKLLQMQQEQAALPLLPGILAPVQRPGPMLPGITGLSVPQTGVPSTGMGPVQPHISLAPQPPVSAFQPRPGPPIMGLPTSTDIAGRIAQAPAEAQTGLSHLFAPTLLRGRERMEERAEDNRLYQQDLQRVAGLDLEKMTPAQLQAYGIKIGGPVGNALMKVADSRIRGDVAEERAATSRFRAETQAELADIRRQGIELRAELGRAQLAETTQHHRATEGTAQQRTEIQAGEAKSRQALRGEQIQHLRALTARAKQGGAAGNQARQELNALRADLNARRGMLQQEMNVLTDPYRNVNLNMTPEQRNARLREVQEELSVISESLRAIAAQRPGAPEQLKAAPASRGGNDPLGIR